MTAILFPRKLNQLNDVVSAGIQPGDVPTWDGASYTLGPGGGGGGGSFSMGVSTGGNTLGQTGITGSRLVLAGVGNITLSQLTDLNGGTISISGAGGGGGDFSMGVSGGNTAGDTGATGSRVVLAGGNGITLSQATDANGGTITVSGITQSAQTQDRFDLTLAGNTAGVLALVSSGTLTLAGGANITLSQNGNAVTVVGAAGGVETQTFVGGLAGSNTTYTSGTITITGVGGGVTVSSNTGQRIDISVAAPVAQTGTQFSAGISGGNTSGHSGTVAGRVVFVGGNNVTLSGSTNGASETITISAFSQTLQTSNVHNVTLSGNTAGAMAQVSSGTMTLAGGNNITLSQAGNAITISGANAGGAQTGISGIAASNTTYTSGSVTFTGVGGGVTVSSNTGQRIDISVAAPVAQTNQAGSLFAIGNTTSSTSGTWDARTLSISGAGMVSVAATNSGFKISATQSLQTSNVHNVTLSGNTAGAMAQISSGTMTLAGGNNITLSQAGNAVTISAAAQTAQTGISSIVASDATYTSGSVQFTGSGIVTVRSSANQRVVIDASQSVQTQNMVAVTLSGNTSGAQALISSGTMTIAGGNNITVSQAGNAVTISGANVGGAQTGISGLANSQTTYTSGTVSMSELGAITIRSTTGNQYQFSVNAQTTQPGVQHFVVSNTTFSSGTVSISGFGDVTVNTAANIIRISAPAQTAETAISGIANSQTTYTSGTVSLSELGAITIRSTTGNQFQLSVNAQTEQTQSRFNLTISGNTAGAGALISSGVMTLAGGNNVTLSQAGNAITISGGAGGGFSAGVSTGGNTAGDTGVTGTRLVFVGTNNITLSQATAAAGGTVTISGPTQTNDAGGVYAVGNTYSTSSGTFDVRTLSIRGDGIISVAASNSGWRISASQSVQAETQTFVGGIAASNTTYTSGTITITGVGGGVTVSSNTGQRVDISVAAQSVQPGVQHFVVSNTTFSSGTVSISGFGDVTVNTAANIIRISAPVQTAQTGISGLANSQTTYTSGTVSLSELGAITIRSTTGNQYQFSVNSQTLQTSNVHNVTLSGNTAGAMAQISSGTMTLAGGNNITLSQAGNAVTISGGAGGGFSAGVSTGGNTQGNTGVTGTRLVIVGTNNITLSQNTDANGATISISGQSPAGGAFSGGASNLGNTAGATGITGTQLVLVGTNAISLSQTTGANGGTLSIDAPATSSLVGASGISISTNGSTISVMQTTGSGFLTSFAPYDESPMVTGQHGQGTLHMMPIRFPEAVIFDRMAVGVQISNATNSSNSITLSQWVGIYSRSNSSLSLAMSTSISTNFTGSGTVGSYSLYAGPKQQTIGWTTTVTEGDWYVAVVMRTTTGGGAGHSISQLCQSKFTNSAWSGILGAATNATDQRLLGQGYYTVSTSGMPASIAFTQLQGSGSMALRPPIWHVRSGTV